MPSPKLEETYRAIFVHAREGILVAAPDSRTFKYANPAICAMLGYPEDELLRLGVADIHPKEALPQVFSRFDAHLHGEPTLTRDLPCVRKDGSVFFADVQAGPAVIDGRLHVVGFFTDVTARKAAEEKLAASEMKFAAAFDNALLPMAIADLETGRLVDANEAMAASLGYTKGEIIGRGTKELGVWVRPEQREQMVALARAQGRFKDFSILVRPRSGDIRHVVLCGSVFQVAGRGYLVTTSQDVTESERAQEQRTLSEKKFRLAFNVGPDAMALADLDGDRLVEVNEALAAWSGYSREELIGHSSLGLGLWARPKDRAPAVARLLKTGSARLTTQARLKDGSIRDVILMASKLEIGGKTYALTLVHDITDMQRLLESERRARTEAEAASQAKDDFLAMVSHELRTPLTAIQGWAWLLRDAGPEERAEAVDVILRSVQAQQQIINDLIDSASLTRGQLILTSRTVDLAEVIPAACGSLQRLAQDRSIRLDCALQGPAKVIGDVARLQQVFWNLLSNALKFSPEAGEVGVRLRREADQAVVEVADHGQGISPDFLPHIFEPFRQGETPLTREHGGLGLGLSIVKRLVELHGGTVGAASPGLGQGAVFTVRLPLAAARVPAAAPPPGSAIQGGLAGLRVLLVEDDADTQRFLARLLALDGAQIETASDAAQAWRSLECQTPDLLLCDIAMPGEDGCAFLRRLRARGGRFESLPAAALTALARDEDRTRVLEAGFQTYLSKPIDPPELLKALQQLASRR